jgi:hypothetical protein
MNTGAKRKKHRHLLLFLLGIAPAAGAALFLFLRAGALLVVDDPVPRRLDVIFTFAGENQRVTYSRDLTERFPSAHWVLSDFYHLFSHILERDGFAMSRVTFLDTCTNTLSEVHGLRDWIAGHKDSLYKSQNAVTNSPAVPQKPATLAVGLVSTPFHMRRIRFMMQAVFRDPSIRFYYLPVPLDRYHWTSNDVDFWWQSRTTRSWVKSEVGKLLAFWFFS